MLEGMEGTLGGASSGRTLLSISLSPPLFFSYKDVTDFSQNCVAGEAEPLAVNFHFHLAFAFAFLFQQKYLFIMLFCHSPHSSRDQEGMTFIAFSEDEERGEEKRISPPSSSQNTFHHFHILLEECLLPQWRQRRMTERERRALTLW